MKLLIDRQSRLPRLWSNSVLRQIAPLFSGDAINVSGWDDRDKEGGRYRDYFISVDRYHVSNHAGERGLEDDGGVTDFAIDLEGPLADELVGRFDVVYNHTTLEHILNVSTAIDNLCRMTRDAVIVVVPFAQHLHYNESWGDYWRFTPMALRRLFEQNGLQVVFEAASPAPKAGVYLLLVASRAPEKWRGKFPAWEPVERLGDWIGDTFLRRVRRRLMSLLSAR